MERARQLPSWTDPGQAGYRGPVQQARKGNYIGVLYGFATGMMSTAIPKEARAVYYAKGGADMKDRISKTDNLGLRHGIPTGPRVSPTAR